MTIEKIGNSAGIVWNILNVNGPSDYVDLKRSTLLTDAMLYSAIGWLAREGKIKEVKPDVYELV